MFWLKVEDKQTVKVETVVICTVYDPSGMEGLKFMFRSRTLHNLNCNFLSAANTQAHHFISAEVDLHIVRYAGHTHYGV